jgi:glycosyltransferase involved in cell wall biosynthesis
LRDFTAQLSNVFRCAAAKRNADPAVPANYRRLKILYVCGILPGTRHGGGQRLLDLLTRLGRRHDIDLYAVRRPFDDLAPLNALRGAVGNLSLTGACPVDVRLLWKWLHSIGRDRCYYDIVQLEYPYARHLAEAVRRFGRKVGYTFMECETLRRAMDVARTFDDPQRCGPRLLEFLDAARAEFEVSRHADFTVAVTPEDRDFVIKFGGQAPAVIPTCLPDEFFKAFPDDERGSLKPSAAFVACFDHEPNVDAMEWYLKEVHPRVLEKIGDYRIDVIGAGRLEPVIKMSAGDPSVRMVGYAEDLPRAIRETRIGISPLVSGAGIRGKVNQYAAAGRPVVATSISLMGLPYADGESIVRADTPEDFAAGMIRLLTDEAFYRRLQRNAYRMARECFRWDPMFEKLEKIYLGLARPTR